LIWIWARRLLFFIGWLLIPPPALAPHPVRNPNADCPSCGNTDGKIRCIPMHPDGKSPGVILRHTCNICGAQWHEDTVIKDNANWLYPSDVVTY
jgi:hypothetical protein